MKTTVGHCEHDSCDVYIGRRDGGKETIQNAPPGECFGNPYTLENHSRGASIRKFADLIGTLLEERPVYRLHVRDLADKTLGCWCRRVNEGEPACHGDILAARADQLHEQMVSGGGQPCERGEHWLVQYRQWRECVHCGISGQTLSAGAIDRTGADLWSEDNDGASRERSSLGTHRISAVSGERSKPGHEATEPDNSDSDSPVEGGSGNNKSESNARKADAHGRRAPTRAGVPPSDHFITTACDETYHKLRKINSAEGEHHLPAGGSPTRTCFFPAQDNIVCHSPSDSYGLLSTVTAKVSDSLGYDGSPGRQRWNDGAHQ